MNITFEHTIGIISSIFMIVLILFIMEEVSVDMTRKIMYQRCCNGNVCTDTILINDTCILTICDNNGFKNCTYKADNLSAEWIKNHTIYGY